MGTTSAAPAISFNKRECLNLNEIGETSFPLPDEADAHALLLLGDPIEAGSLGDLLDDVLREATDGKHRAPKRFLRHLKKGVRYNFDSANLKILSSETQDVK